MSALTDILDRFNRKERNLLIQDALGHTSKKPLRLDVDFRRRIGVPLDNLKIPDYAWWATDYHLNWIAGALVLFCSEPDMICVAQSNQSADLTSMLIKQSQEDVDFLIVFDTTMILVEVKAFGYFSKKQIESKQKRWQELERYSKSLRSNMTFHFMLMSQEPDGSKLPHAKLEVESPSRKLKVTGKRPGTIVPPVDTNTWYIVPVCSDARGNRDQVPIELA